MYETITASLNAWNATKSERQKLQHGYLALALFIVLLAGIVSLFKASYGHDLVVVALGVLITFAINAIVWNLLQSSLISKLSTKPRRK
jgi:hypothetical protein